MYQERTQKDGWKCPNCGSENFQSVPIIHESGRSSFSSSTESVGLVANYHGVGIGGATSASSGQRISDLSNRLAPPREPSSKAGQWPGIGFLVGGSIGFLLSIYGEYYFWGVVIGFVLGIVFTNVGFSIGERKYQNQNEQAKRKYETEMIRWKASYFCFRCGHLFQRS